MGQVLPRGCEGLTLVPQAHHPETAGDLGRSSYKGQWGSAGMG